MGPGRRCLAALLELTRQVMPGGKLFDTLVPQSKLARDGISILCISQKPGPRTAVVLDLATSAGEQMNMGDVLVLVRGWP